MISQQMLVRSTVSDSDAGEKKKQDAKQAKLCKAHACEADIRKT